MGFKPAYGDPLGFSSVNHSEEKPTVSASGNTVTLVIHYRAYGAHIMSFHFRINLTGSVEQSDKMTLGQYKTLQAAASLSDFEDIIALQDFMGDWTISADDREAMYDIVKGNASYTMKLFAHIGNDSYQEDSIVFSNTVALALETKAKAFDFTGFKSLLTTHDSTWVNDLNDSDWLFDYMRMVLRSAS